MKINRNTHSAFTLVELAIVIVIIGLLVGGVLQGQALIQQAKINSTISKIQGYNAAANTFKSKYNQLPGDIPTPGQFGLNNAKGEATVNTCITGLGGTTSLTNGNSGDGNGIFAIQTGANCTATSGGVFTYSYNYGAAPTGEMANFFVHLANAQLVKESFTQATATLPSWPWVNPYLGTAFPVMSVGNGMVLLTDSGVNYWSLGTAPTHIQTLSRSVGNSLTPAEANSIDSKIDDSNPGTGVTQAVEGYANAVNSKYEMATPGAATCVLTGGALYNFTGSYGDSKLCSLRVKVNF